MNEKERVNILKKIRVVDNTKDVSKSIQMVYKKFSNKYEIFFGNGGDQNNSSIPEIKICKKLDIKLIDKLGDKIQSSSWLLKK